ncbi:hypothetical protein NLI96_g6460 [Meripilus lineatus]|uniref:Uncharacterized protein n=1 Tax=Meripilus lineatus TaxID=2056292 RepID=A0AAD5YDV7_9APHY|nr:hypothetical protein NLI96_g6460 [Physisporinus lineatus]
MIYAMTFGSPVSAFATIFSTVLFTRLILNLRTVDQIQMASIRVGSINFASGMGAPIEVPDNTSNRLSYASAQHQIEDPLSIGILHAHTGGGIRCVFNMPLPDLAVTTSNSHVAVKTKERPRVNNVYLEVLKCKPRQLWIVVPS